MRSTYRQLLTVLAFVFGAATLSAQLELGIKLGGATYSGDLTATTFQPITDDLNFAGGAYLRYRPIQRVGIRIDGNFGRLSSQRDYLLRDENEVPRSFSREFRTSLTEFSLLAELDLFYIGDRESNYFAPYIFGGAGVMTFNPQAPNRDGNYVDLQPLATEGQGLDDARYATAPYELTRVVGIGGGGIRARFSEKFVVGLEVGLRFTGTDYIDDIGATSVNYADIVAGPGGTEAAQLSNPAVQNPIEVRDFTYVRGGRFDDYYLIGGLTFGMTIGGGSSKSGCYSF